MKHLVLAGCGHAQLAVLQSLRRNKMAATEVTLVTPAAAQPYSGMLPGWMTGYYSTGQVTLDAEALAASAGATLVLDNVAALDAERRRLVLASGRMLRYDTLSLDIGSEIETAWLASVADRLLPARPLGAFMEGWSRILDAADRRPDLHLVVVGGGAAAFEIAMAASCRLRRPGTSCRVSMIMSASGLLPGFPGRVRSLAQAAAIRREVDLRPGPAVGVEGGLLLPDGTLIVADHVVAATGASAPCWLRNTGLALDERGYVLVNATHGSVSHPDVFAAGDVCSRIDAPLQKSGVYAVRAGPVLAANLYARASGRTPGPFRPRQRSLYLLSSGPGHAIGTWGGLTFSGSWAWRWKDSIDRSFMARQRVSGSGVPEPACFRARPRPAAGHHDDHARPRETGQA